MCIRDSINMGRGAIVIGLASVIIGEVIFGARFNFAYQLGSIVAGSVIYQIVIAFVLQLGPVSYTHLQAAFQHCEKHFRQGCGGYGSV